jgi:hypothetical protein
MTDRKSGNATGSVEEDDEVAEVLVEKTTRN